MNIIPKPAKLTFPKIANITCRLSSPELADSDLAYRNGALRLLKCTFGVDPNVENFRREAEATLQIIQSTTLDAEAYRISSLRDRVRVEASTARGLAHALQTLRQLGKQDGDCLELAAVEIEDSPRFAWRGMHLDVSRSFFPVTEIRRFIDLLAFYKFNVFHWHLTDDQGWRIEIRKYPELTRIGSVRPGTPFHGEHDRSDQVSYGGYYTQDEIREIVRYAADREIQVMPEIDMPGHARAVLAAYPELGNDDIPGWEPPRPWDCWGISCYTLNLEEKTFAFIEDVLTEVAEMFPSPHIHIGCDEAPVTQWIQSPRAMERVRELGLEGSEAIQAWYVSRLAEILQRLGRRLVGWDEILDGGAPAGATITAWRTSAWEQAVSAARQGFDVIMAPKSHTYFDYAQSDSDTASDKSTRSLTLERVLEFEPIPGELKGAERARIIGGQGQLWTERIPGWSQLIHMALPRMSALSEVLWSPARFRDPKEFRERFAMHTPLLDAMGCGARRPKCLESSLVGMAVVTRLSGLLILMMLLACSPSKPLEKDHPPPLDGARKLIRGHVHNDAIARGEALMGKVQAWTDEELAAEIVKSRPALRRAHPFGEAAYAFSLHYRRTGDIRSAREARRVLLALADAERDQPEPELDRAGIWLEYLPEYSLHAFAAIHDAPGWDETTRGQVEEWFRACYRHFSALPERTGELHNLTPLGLRQLMAMAMILRDAAMAETVLTMAESLYSWQYFCTDGTWNEGAPSYFQQTIGNMVPVLEALADFDRASRAEDSSKNAAGMESRIADLWKLHERYARTLDGMRFPDGTFLTHGDSHWDSSGGEFQKMPALRLYDYGLFSLAHGDSASGLAAYLAFPPRARGGKYGGGHHHDDRLALTLWSNGTDVLSDQGYPVYDPKNHRYFHMSSWTHNMTVATDANRTFKPDDLKGEWNRSALLTFEVPGEGSPPIQLLAAASPGPEEEGIEIAERWLLLVGTSARRAYLVDVFWVRGGTVHESFLRPFDEEDATMQVSLPLQPAGRSLGELLGNRSGYLPQYRSLFRDVQMPTSEDDLRVDWTGKISGVTIRAWLQAIGESETYFSRMPRLRPAGRDPAKKDAFPGWHLYRRRDVRPDDLTCVAAIYDCWGSGHTPVIESVRWLNVHPATPEAIGVEIRHTDSIDRIYLSRDAESRHLDGGVVQGTVAAWREQEGKVQWSYLLGNGSIQVGSFEHSQSGDLHAALIAVGHDSRGAWLDIDEDFSSQSDILGRWCQLFYDDGSGNGYQIASVEKTESGGSRIRIEGDHGLVSSPDGFFRQSYPKGHRSSGPAKLQVLRSSIRTDTSL